MKRIYLVFILVYLILMLIGAFTRVKAQQWEWARKSDLTASYQDSRDICSDASGNVFVIGSNAGPATYNSIVINPGSFIIKYNSTGTFLWGQNIDGELLRIQTDVAGNVYVLGNFYNNISIGTFHFNVNGFSDFFLAKFSDNGSVIWARAFGDTAEDGAADFAMDDNGNSFVTGYYKNSISFDNYQLSDSTVFGVRSFFLAKINSSGMTQWANSGPFNNPSSNLQYFTGTAIRLTKNGDMYILGRSVDSSNSPCPDYFIMKCNASGQMQLTTQHFDNCFNTSNALAVDNNSNVYYIFNPTGHYYYTPVLAKYDSLLNPVWNLGLSDGLYFQKYTLHVGLSTDTAGNVFVAGVFGGTHASYGDSVLAYNRLLIRKGMNDVLISKFDGDGNCMWLKNAGGKNMEESQHMYIDKKGCVYLAGYYNYAYSNLIGNDTVNFDNHQLTNDGTWPQMFVAKLLPPFTTNVPSASPSSKIYLYPNPTSSTFTLNCPLSFVSSPLKIYNYYGQLVHSQIINQQSTVINLQSQPKGIYIVEAGNERRKIVLN